MTSGHGTRLKHLDGLRGVAALAVVYQHLLEHLGPLAPLDSWLQAHAQWTLGSLNLGKLGVVVFFAISGYIVPFSFSGPAPRWGFVVSRFFRLYPAYWLSLAAAFVLFPVLGMPQLPAATWLANVTMLQKLLHQPDVLGVYWTLLIELLFYGLCLGLFCLGRLRSPLLLGGLAGLLLLLALAGALTRAGGGMHLPVVLPVAMPMYLTVMLLGTLFRLADDGAEHGELVQRTARRLLAPLLCAVVVVVPVAWLTAYDPGAHRESDVAAVCGFGFGLLLFIATVRWRWFAAAPWVWLGDRSYAVYLFHPLALMAAVALVGVQGADGSEARPDWPAQALQMVAVTLALTAAAAHAVQAVIEQPAIRLGRRLRQGLGRCPHADPMPGFEPVDRRNGLKNTP